MSKNNKKMNKGEVTVLLLVVIFIFSMVMMPIINLAVVQSRVIRNNSYKEQALQIAEAGVNYYQWRLAHFPTDYQDGTGIAGPYVHDYKDYNTQTVIGQYSLEITPPLLGSTIVTIQSTGWTSENPNVKKTITARYGVPSLATYASLNNDVIWLGATSTVNGKMHSNNGIRFEGTANAPITSARDTYTCGSNQGCSSGGETKNGVWGSPPQATQNFWQFPVPSVSFAAITANLAEIKDEAENGGIYLPPSNDDGYSIVFNSNGTVSVYKVNSLRSTPDWSSGSGWNTSNLDYNTRTLQFTQAIPSNGAIYIEDNTWVEGTVRGRVMLAAAKLPYSASSAPNIYIPNNIVYSAKDGTDVLGLLAQQSVAITYRAPDFLEIDAAIIAQNEAFRFYNYESGATQKIKNTLTMYGSTMTFIKGGIRWTSGGSIVSGYPTAIYNYDDNLLYSPPPLFPISSEGYKQLSWISN
jgi:hypothetical protein